LATRASTVVLVLAIALVMPVMVVVVVLAIAPVMPVMVITVPMTLLAVGERVGFSRRCGRG